MANRANSPTDDRGGRVAAGWALIAVGLGIFLLQFVEGPGEALVLLGLGGAFTAGYLYWRVYGLMIPGGILLGLGLGSIVDSADLFVRDFDKIGLGIGFLLIYLVPVLRVRSSHWWPLIPGGILVVGGLAASYDGFRRLVENGWPLLLVLAGIVILVRAFDRRRQT